MFREGNAGLLEFHPPPAPTSDAEVEQLAVMTPLPETNLLICHGVLAPNARWRERVATYGFRVAEPTARRRR